MFATAFRWEVRALSRDPAFWLAVVLAFAAVAFALQNGGHWLAHVNAVQATAVLRDVEVREEARTYAARLDRKEERAPFYTRDPRNTLGYANSQMAHFAVLPPTPLAALTTGQSDLLPSMLPLRPARLPLLADGFEPENPHRLLIGRFDAAFFVVFLLPLLIIALTYALVAGERERGTLALLLAQPVTLRSLFAAKLLPRLLMIFAVIGLLMALFALLIGMDAFPRLALWTAVALAFAAFWFALSAAVAVRRASAATHAVALAALWLVFTVLLPASVNLVVKAFQPIPSRIDLILAMREATDKADAERSQLLGAFYEDHPELAPGGAEGSSDEFATLQLVTGQAVERELAPVLARYEEQLGRQQALVERLQFLSPALMTQAALAEAAGTGLARHRWFIGQARAHHADLRAFFEPRALRGESFAAWDDVPAFRYLEEPTGDAFRRIAPALALLLFSSLVLGLWTWRVLGHSARISS
jgi:ABC-2 type transport system permease protein